MLFYLICLIFVSMIGFGTYLTVSGFFEGGDGEDKAFFGFVSCFLSIIPLAIIIITWVEHAEDLSKIRSQQHVIEVYEERQENLNETLSTFNYPRRENDIVLNADSPVASIVEQLSEVETKLAGVRAEVAYAKRSIDARSIGPLGGIVTIMGRE